MLAKSRKVVPVLVATILLGGMACRSAAAPSLVMVVPARQTMVQVGLDMVQLRGATLISYRQSSTSDRLAAFAWVRSEQRWAEVELNEQGLGTILSRAEAVIVVGQDEASARLLRDAGWSGSARTIPTLVIMEVVNQLNEVYAFNAREWRWLAGRYKLELEDLNYEQRRYGRYGPPGGRPAQGMRTPQSPAAEVPSETETIRMETITPAQPAAPAAEVSAPREQMLPVTVPVNEPVEEKGSVSLPAEVAPPAPAAPTVPAAREQAPEDK